METKYPPRIYGGGVSYRQTLRNELGAVNAEWRRLQKDTVRSAIKTRRLGELRERRHKLCVELFETRDLDGRVQVYRHAQGE
jgi:hypothetical protein